ncbi:DUF1641 domain-containing protein [Phaeodactylibacter luteus]|uniref:DUF1641 domain-containing protein n=1 Tax=Phaeodactylibacter luteus TaxID=1564516 RepID=A0A5C6RKL4_9BACT|nr:DUF1641 domain-containing protein [Phaeodactylibacter luteus]TXB62951.1 DUF1641 domain-containing protein [Phaeodactylibacter luteus]
METNGSVHWAQTEAGHQLQQRLNDERTLRSLDHLLQRIETLEQAVDRLATALEQGPGLASMAADAADEAVAKAQQRGVDLEERLGNALHLAEQLTSPAMVARIDQLNGLAEQLPGLASMAADAADEGYQQAALKGIDLSERLGIALGLAEQLTRPETAGRLGQLLALSEQLPGLAAMGVDILDEGARQAAESGIDWSVLSGRGVEMLGQLSTLLASEEFKALMQSGVLDPCTLKVIAKAGEAMVDSNREDIKPAGMWGALRALGDKDRQKALGFLLSFSKHFGKRF